MCQDIYDYDDELDFMDEDAPARSVEVTNEGEILVVPKREEFNTELLEVGKKYSYKELVELLDINYATGNAKQKQLRDLSRYLNLEKQGTKYLLKEIYNPPMPQEVQFPSYAKYVNEMVDMMLVYLFNKASEIVILDFNELYNVCGLVNKQYLFYNGRKEELAQKQNMKGEEVRQFYFAAASFAKSLVKAALNAMSSRKIIKYYTFYDITISQGDGQPLYHRKADDDDLSEILIAEKQALDELHYSSIKEANATYINRELYYRSFLSHIKERNPYWRDVRKLTKVIAPMDIIVDEIVSSQSRKALNEKVYNHLKDHASTTQRKYGGYLGYTEEWLDHQYILCDTLLLT